MFDMFVRVPATKQQAATMSHTVQWLSSNQLFAESCVTTRYLLSSSVAVDTLQGNRENQKSCGSVTLLSGHQSYQAADVTQAAHALNASVEQLRTNSKHTLEVYVGTGLSRKLGVNLHVCLIARQTSSLNLSVTVQQQHPCNRARLHSKQHTVSCNLYNGLHQHAVGN